MHCSSLAVNQPLISPPSASPKLSASKRGAPVATPVIMPTPSEPVKVSYSNVSQPPVRVVREHHRPPSQNVIPSERDRPADINMQEFLPVSCFSDTFSLIKTVSSIKHLIYLTRNLVELSRFFSSFMALCNGLNICNIFNETVQETGTSRN